MRVLIVDDHGEVRAMLRIGLRTRPALRIVGEAVSLADAVDQAGTLRPEAIVLDLVLPDAGRDPHAALTAIRQAAPDSRVVVYTAWESDRNWYEQEGVPFFGKGTDSIDDLADLLSSGPAAGAR